MPEQDEYRWITEDAYKAKVAAKAKERLRRIQEMAENFLVQRVSHRDDITKSEAARAVKVCTEVYDQVQIAIVVVNP